MNRLLSLAFVALSGAAPALAEEEPVGSPIPAARILEFRENLAVAEWIVRYDRAATLATGVVRKAPPERFRRLGHEWFCYEEKEGWHAVYGRLSRDGKTYDAVFHLLVDAEGRVTERDTAKIRPDHLALARAAQGAYFRVFRPLLHRFRVRLNPYVRKTKDGVEVWFMPAWQHDGRIVLGQTHRLRFSADGTTLLGHDEWDYLLRSVRPDREKKMRIGDAKFDSPTVGDLFFAIHFGSRFKSVTIRSKTFTTRRIDAGGVPKWLHVPT